MAKAKELEEASVVNLEEINEVWKVVFSGPVTQEKVLILADCAEMALRKALHYQNQYTIICDWPLTSLERISSTVI